MISLRLAQLSIILFLSFILTGYQKNNTFELKANEKKELNVIKIDSNRILQECRFMNAEKENQWRHQYLLHILNEKGAVITAAYPINQEKEECLAHLQKVERIFKKEPKVILCLRGILKKESHQYPHKDMHDFGRLGRYSSPYEYLTFDSICNAKECYSISDTWIYTCPDLKKQF